jgi:N-acetylmuramoyl-L-alanine amidase
MRSITRLCTWILAGSASIAQAADVNGVRLWTGPEGTRVVLDLQAPVRYQVFSLDDPDRVVIDIEQARWAAADAPGAAPSAPCGMARSRAAGCVSSSI